MRFEDRPYYFVLEGHEPVPTDMRTWARWFEKANSNETRRVGLTRVGDVEVSTIFLGLDHNFSRVGPPVLFETMVFEVDDAGDRDWSGVDNFSRRYETWEQAEAGHAMTVSLIEAMVVAVPPGQ